MGIALVIGGWYLFKGKGKPDPKKRNKNPTGGQGQASQAADLRMVVQRFGDYLKETFHKSGGIMENQRHGPRREDTWGELINWAATPGRPDVSILEYFELNRCQSLKEHPAYAVVKKQCSIKVDACGQTCDNCR